MRLPEIGLDYYFQAPWARFYDPQIGRFLTPDPAGFVDGPNLYAYALNDPINNVDPTGLHSDCSGGTCVETDDLVIPAPAKDMPPGRAGFIGQGDTSGGRNGGRNGSAPAAPMMMCPTSSVSMPRGMLAASNYLGSFGQGLGDAVTFGLYSEAFGAIPFGLGECYDSQKENGGGYTPGLAAGAVVGGGRVVYAAGVRSVTSFLSARSAVAFRNDMKGAFSGLGSAHPRNYTYDQMLRKYGSDSAVKAAAGRTNNTLNAAGAGLAASAVAQLAAGCP